MNIAKLNSKLMSLLVPAALIIGCGTEINETADSSSELKSFYGAKSSKHYSGSSQKKGYQPTDKQIGKTLKEKNLVKQKGTKVLLTSKSCVDRILEVRTAGCETYRVYFLPGTNAAQNCNDLVAGELISIVGDWDHEAGKISAQNLAPAGRLSAPAMNRLKGFVVEESCVDHTALIRSTLPYVCEPQDCRAWFESRAACEAHNVQANRYASLPGEFVADTQNAQDICQFDVN